MINVYASVDGRDLGAVSDEVFKQVKAVEKDLPRGSHIVVRGQVQTMRTSFIGLGVGLVGAILLAYLLIVVNFQSWLDPFIIITALPGALAGICWMLLITHTTLNVPSLTGAIMCMGVATANSILMVSFAREQMDGRQERAGSRGGSRLRAYPPGDYDRVGDDYRHGADGHRARRRRRTECAAGTCGDRRSGCSRRSRRCSLCRACFRSSTAGWKRRRQRRAEPKARNEIVTEFIGSETANCPWHQRTESQPRPAQKQSCSRRSLFVGIALVVVGAFTLLQRRSQYAGSGEGN